MFKKSLIAAFVAIMVLMMISTSAFAAEKTTMSPEIAQALTEVETVNAAIYSEIAKAQEEAQEMYNQYRSDYYAADDAETKAALTAKYDEEVTALIHELDMKTREMTRLGVEDATAAGVTVEIEWVPVQFPDRVALIDPLVVIGW
ncbi:hypothetical protein [Planococcus shenhongbingii]|uniref:OmpH family outer membrane protein n=1 Tax=Planococcus shenhongbingii TaxID=3058398 RepID=A0ABT8NBD2_9BACL|nr:hypothetical protein [Planococcus sp. N017]MDN7245078.1 hypothetical protein [Planococcus sp. N017]